MPTSITVQKTYPVTRSELDEYEMVPLLAPENSDATGTPEPTPPVNDSGDVPDGYAFNIYRDCMSVGYPPTPVNSDVDAAEEAAARKAHKKAKKEAAKEHKKAAQQAKVEKARLVSEKKAEQKKAKFQAKVQAMMDKEAAWMSTQIYTALELDRTCQHVIGLLEGMVKRWTDLNGLGANAMTENYEFEPFECDETGQFVEQEVKNHRGTLLNLLKQSIKLVATATGTTSGVAKDLRELYVFHLNGFVQPLAAMDNKEEEFARLQQALKNCAEHLPKILKVGGLSTGGCLSRFLHPLLHRTWDRMEHRTEYAQANAEYIPSGLMELAGLKIRPEEEDPVLMHQFVYQMMHELFISAMWDTAEALVDALVLAEKIAQWDPPKTFSSRIRGCMSWSNFNFHSDSSANKYKNSEDAKDLREAMVLCENIVKMLRATKRP